MGAVDINKKNGLASQPPSSLQWRSLASQTPFPQKGITQIHHHNAYMVGPCNDLSRCRQSFINESAPHTEQAYQ